MKPSLALNQRLGDLEAFLVRAFAEHDIRYTMDARVKSMIDEVRRVHLEEKRELTGRLLESQRKLQATKRELDEVVATRDDEVAAVRQSASQQVNRQRDQLRKEGARELRKLRKTVRINLEREFEQRVEERVAEVEQQLQEQVERKLRSEQAGQLQATVQVLEERAVGLIEKKVQYIRRLEAQVDEIGTRLDQSRHEAADLRKQLSAREGDLVRERADNTSLRTRLDQLESMREQDKSMLLARLQKQTEASGRVEGELSARVNELERQLEDQRRRMHRKHNTELEQLQQRIQVIISKKDAAAARLRERLDKAERRNKKLEQFLATKKRELAGL